MYAVVQIGGAQYRVTPGEILDVEKLEKESGIDIDLDQVLFIGGKSPVTGGPTVAGAKIQARVLKHDRSRKLLVFKKFGKKWRRSQGHRQNYTSLLVTSIDDGNGNVAKIDPASKEAQKHLEVKKTTTKEKK